MEPEKKSHDYFLPLDGLSPKPRQEEIENRVFQALQAVCAKRGIDISKVVKPDSSPEVLSHSDATPKEYDRGGSSGGTGRQYRYIVDMEPQIHQAPRPKPQQAQVLEHAPEMQPDAVDALSKGLEDMANALVDILAPTPPAPRLEGPKQEIEHKKELVLRITPQENAYQLTYQPPAPRPKNPGDLA